MIDPSWTDAGLAMLAEMTEYVMSAAHDDDIPVSEILDTASVMLREIERDAERPRTMADLCELVDAGICTPPCLFGTETGPCQCRCGSEHHAAARLPPEPSPFLSREDAERRLEELAR